MEKNILIINSSPEQRECLLECFWEIKNQGFKPRFLVNSPFLAANIKEQDPESKNIRFLNPQSKPIAFSLLLPLWFLIHFNNLLFYKLKHKTDILLLCAWPEKIIFTPLAKIFNIKILWIEFPGKNLPAKGLLARLYRFNSKYAKLIVLESATKRILESKNINKNNIAYILPGIKNRSAARQENIFSPLAESGKNTKNKYFTIGTVLPAGGGDNLEILCQALKNSLSVISNAQLIIIGDKSNKQNLSWYTKKIGISDIVWFVGEPKFYGKWLSNFDLFILTNSRLSAFDLMLAIRAASFGLPLIGMENIGLEDIIINEKNGYLTNAGDAEAMAQAIIKLKQNPHLRKRLGEAGKEHIDKHFQLDRMVGQFIEILNAK